MAEQPTVKIRGGRQGKNTERAAKVKRSAFFLTISTNQRYAEDDPNIENDEAVFEESIQSVLQDMGKYIRFRADGHSWTSGKIQSVEVDYTVERGRTNQIHTHILIKIKHDSNIQLDYGAIKKKICDDLGLDNLYVNNKLLGQNAWSHDVLLSYVNKMLGGFER
jgi:hypothetical protein